MLKRTKGRLLLTLLVITGLAGTIHDSSLSQKERSMAILLLKNSRTEMLNSVQGLTSRQLRYKAAPGQFSIEEYVYAAAQSEMNYQQEMKSNMKKPSNPEKRFLIQYTDTQAKMMAEEEKFPVHSLLLQPRPALFKRPVDALVKFQSLRQDHIRYIRTSTEDMRNHVVSTPGGWMDSYQYILTLAAQTNYLAAQINTIRSLPGFPVK